MEGFDINAVVAYLVKDYVKPPDYSQLMEEVNAHRPDDFVMLHQEPALPGLLPIPYKVLFTTSDTIIVQPLDIEWGDTRFQVRKIDANEWSDKFVEWVTTEDKNWELLRSKWDEGCEMYGAVTGY